MLSPPLHHAKKSFTCPVSACQTAVERHGGKRQNDLWLPILPALISHKWSYCPASRQDCYTTKAGMNSQSQALRREQPKQTCHSLPASHLEVRPEASAQLWLALASVLLVGPRYLRGICSWNPPAQKPKPIDNGICKKDLPEVTKSTSRRYSKTLLTWVGILTESNLQVPNLWIRRGSTVCLYTVSSFMFCIP